MKPRASILGIMSAFLHAQSKVENFSMPFMAFMQRFNLRTKGKGHRANVKSFSWSNRSKYTPHQGKRECARRLRQMGATA